MTTPEARGSAVGPIIETVITNPIVEKIKTGLERDGYWYFVKDETTPDPSVPLESGLLVKKTGQVLSGENPENNVWGFLVYDPKRVEVRITFETDEKTRNATRYAMINAGWNVAYPCAAIIRKFLKHLKILLQKK
jgi:hypothetical protein